MSDSASSHSGGSRVPKTSHAKHGSKKAVKKHPQSRKKGIAPARTLSKSNVSSSSVDSAASTSSSRTASASASSHSSSTLLAATPATKRKSSKSSKSSAPLLIRVPRAAAPVIGINTDIVEDNPRHARIYALYLDAIRLVGGTPLLLPTMDDAALGSLVPVLDGVMFIGGADYDPAMYGEAPHDEVSMLAAERLEFDLRMARAVGLGAGKNAERARCPVFGICGGAQLINIARGGTLTQHVPDVYGDAVMHTTDEGWENGWNFHEVTLSKGSKLRDIYGTPTVSVVTSHHQAVGKLGSGLRVVARAADGCPEAIEGGAKEPFLLGVQWHPERAFKGSKRLFKAFVEAAADFRSRRK